MAESAGPVLSVCMIVRDSSRTLGECLDSIRGWVDEIIVVDTGSIDDSRAVARDFGAHVFEFPWVDDFAAARNESLRHAKGQWLFWMDSDDTIDEDNGRELRALANGQHASKTLGYVVQVQCPAKDDEGIEHSTVVDHVKLIKNDPRIRFEGRIHEQVLPSIRRAGGAVEWTDLFVVHSGSDHSPKGKQRKIERDLRILKLDIAERPDHPFVLFNLGMTYENIGDADQAERWLRRCLSVSNPTESHVRKAYALLTSCLAKAGRVPEAQATCEEGLAHFPGDRELSFRRGLLLHTAGALDEAVVAYRSVLTPKVPRHFTSIDAGISGYKTRHNLALALSERGDYKSAELQWRLVIDDAPAFLPAWRGLGQTLAAQKKVAALEILAQHISCHGDAADSLWLQALAAEQNKQSSDVKTLLEKALAIDPDHLHARQDYCRWLFYNAAPSESERALRELIARVPDHAAAFHNLGMLLSSRGRIQEAIEALERSLQLRPGSLAVQSELSRLQQYAANDEGTRQTRPSPQFFSETSAREVASLHPTLPECHSRRAIPGVDDRFHCLHPRVHSQGQIVRPEMCRACAQWQSPPPENFRSTVDLVPPNRGLACRHIGSHIGLRKCRSCRGNVNAKIFVCNHPGHTETTLAECRVCRDFVVAEPVHSCS